MESWRSNGPMEPKRSKKSTVPHMNPAVDHLCIPSLYRRHAGWKTIKCLIIRCFGWSSILEEWRSLSIGISPKEEPHQNKGSQKLKIKYGFCDVCLRIHNTLSLPQNPQPRFSSSLFLVKSPISFLTRESLKWLSFHCPSLIRYPSNEGCLVDPGIFFYFLFLFLNGNMTRAHNLVVERLSTFQLWYGLLSPSNIFKNLEVLFLKEKKKAWSILIRIVSHGDKRQIQSGPFYMYFDILNGILISQVWCNLMQLPFVTQMNL